MAETFTFERIYLASVEQSNAVNASADKGCTSKNMACFYADCIRADFMARRSGQPRVDFKVVNEAILKRWPKGLNRIKEVAWKQLEGGR